MLDDEDISGIATALRNAQLRRISEAIRCVRDRYPQIDIAIVTGLGAFLGLEAGRAAGLVANLLSETTNVPPQTAPATAVAWLLHESLVATR
jgi:uncharacterized hydantoinase/oxoprolinase family protein